MSLVLIPAFLLQAEDFVINLDNQIKDDFEVVDMSKKRKKDTLAEKLEFYKEASSKEIPSVPTKKFEIKNTKSKMVGPNYVNTENKKLSQILNEIAQRENKTYILKNKDFLIEDRYKLYNTKDLIKLVRLVSNFELILTKTDMRDTYYADLKLKKDIKTLSIQAKVDLKQLKTLLMTEYGIKLYIGKDLMDEDTKVHLFGTYTIVELIEDLEDQLDIWFDLKGKKLYLAKTREVLFDIKRDGEFSIDFTKQSSASTGAEEGDTQSSTGFSFKIDDYSSEKFLALLKENFGEVIWKKSYSGFVIADVTPSQYKNITNYFKNVEERHELISGEIVLLNFESNDKFKYDMNWTDFFVKMNLLKVGANGMLIADAGTNMSSTNPEDFGGNINLTRETATGNQRDIGFVQALSKLGEVSIVDKWTISTSTGIPTGFTNYQKQPYYTVEIADGLPATTLTDPDAAATGGLAAQPTTFKLRYALTGFKSTFRVNKTRDGGYVIDGAVDFSTITGFESDANGSKAPVITGKSMRIYSELKELDKTLVIGGFKNLKKSEGGNQMPILGNIPLVGWLFKSKEDDQTESEFVLLIKLNAPTVMSNKKLHRNYKETREIDTIRQRAQRERVDVLGKW